MSVRPGFRADVEGLRAVAIGAVVAYHAGLPFVPGGFVGVDVFFVISGFLITGLVVRELRQTGRVSLSRFYARRAKRLLPAAVLVLAVTAMASWAVLAPIDRPVVGTDIAAAAAYVSNLRFAAQGTDYLAGDRAASPVLHYWSLGVEEQFYLVWPLVLLLVGLAVAWLLNRRGRTLPGRASVGSAQAHPRVLTAALAAVMVAVGAASWVLSVQWTERIAPWAFFGTPARGWEFALGGLVGLAAPWLQRLPVAARAVAGWVGLGLILVAVIRIDADTPYPGTAALLPVLGSCLVLVAGVPALSVARGGPLLLLGTWPMQAVGRLSYSWYLWHWPPLVLLAAVIGPLSVPVGVAVVVASLVPAALAYRFVERPIHTAPALAHRSRPALLVGLGCSLAGLAVGGWLIIAPGGALVTPVVAAQVPGNPDGFGPPLGPSPNPSVPTAGTSGPTWSPSGTPSGTASPTPTPTPSPSPVPTGPIRPAPGQARDDLPITYGNGCHIAIGDTTGPPCVFGDATSGTTIVLLGDSHAAQWFPALERLAEQRRWRLLSRTKSGCPAPDVTIWRRALARAYTECDTWRAGVLDELTRTRPDLVIAASTPTSSLVSRDTGQRLGAAAARADWQDGWTRTATRLAGAGIPVVILRDTPWPGVDIPACVSRHPDDPATCDVSRDVIPAADLDVGLVSAGGPLADEPGVHPVDLTDQLCGPRTCSAVIGRMLVYRDDNHLTATFARSLSASLDAAVDGLIPAAR